jgi:integrase
MRLTNQARRELCEQTNFSKTYADSFAVVSFDLLELTVSGDERMTNVLKANREKPLLSNKELEAMFTRAEALPEGQRLRAKATLVFLECGKRRGEIIRLERQDITVDEQTQNLQITFTLLKKRKKHAVKRTKNLPATGLYAQIVMKYMQWLETHKQGSRWVYPSPFSDRHANDFLIYRIVKQLDMNDWPHQHRERRAVKVLRADELKYGMANLQTIFKVQEALDLEKEDTAYNYISRYGVKKAIEDLDVPI